MATAELIQSRSMQDPELKQHLQRLRKIDSVRNGLAIARTWLILALAIGGAVGFDLWRESQGLHWAWNLPLFAVAILFVGAGQHQLTALGHEGSHHVLLRNRLANELASDWFCMFPLLTTTHHYRLQHMAHHQFVNDPERDPNFGQLQVNGHWIEFPMATRQFWRELASEVLPWNLFNYLRATAKYNAMGGESNPYVKPGGPRANLAKKIGLYYMLAFLIMIVVTARRGETALMLSIAGAASVAVTVFYTLIPQSWFHHSRIHSTVPIRWLSMTRLAFMSGMFTTIGWLGIHYGPRVLVYFGTLWILPVVTSFAFFMMLRQLVQHSNGDRGWITNTRILKVNALIRDSVLPYGQDYHVPHHLYATVPHYHLRELHEILMEYPEYRQHVQIVENAVVPKAGHEYPTIVEMFGPDHTPAARHAAHVDNTVLDGVEVEERDEILKIARRSATG